MSYGQILQSRMLQCTLQNKKRAAEKQEEALFKESPPPEDCPICFLPLPQDTFHSTFKSCCGKLICNGCIYAMDKEAYGRGEISICAFCREPIATTDEGETERIKKMQSLVMRWQFTTLECTIMKVRLAFPKTTKRLMKCG